MTTETDNDLLLPFGDLPESQRPATSASQPLERKASKIKTLIDQCDWEAYEESVLSLLREAIEQYQRQRSDEKIYQISIWTDPQVQTSAINFETREHAERHIAKWAQIFPEKHNDGKTATRLEAEGYNNNPADFKYCQFLEHYHPEIAAIDGLNYYFKTHRHAADARISASLRKVIKRIQEQNLIATLPTEEEVWIGVNSPRDWYDHVTKIEVQP